MYIVETMFRKIIFNLIKCNIETYYSFDDFAKDQPDNDNHTCVDIWKSLDMNSSDYEWDNWRCNFESGFVCQNYYGKPIFVFSQQHIKTQL